MNKPILKNEKKDTKISSTAKLRARSRIDLSVENFDLAITRILKTTFKTL